MSELIRFHLCGDYRARVRAVFPGARPADLVALDALIAADRLVDDAGAAHPALVDWARGILDRRRGGPEADGAAVFGGPGPVPGLGPVGAEVVA